MALEVTYTKGFMRQNSDSIVLGLKPNLSQFSLLVLVNAFVGAMVGLERSILPSLAESEFHLTSNTAVLSFIIAFGISKALMNYFAGQISDRIGRKPVLVMGWLVAASVPALLMTSSHWLGIILANILLGISQGLTWSTTVIMKIDLVGPKRRGFAMGFNEAAGYIALALSAYFTAHIASVYGVRPYPFYLGVIYVSFGLLLSTFAIRETKYHADHEARASLEGPPLGKKEIFLKTTFSDPSLSAITQAGFINNLNDGMAWGLFPLIFASAGLSIKHVGLLAAIYPATWGILQLWTGHLSDRYGRKWMIAAGMWIQAIGILMMTFLATLEWFAVSSLILGAGTAMVYPTLLAAIGDTASPTWRASSVGVYRLWRDLGYAVGAILAGIVADRFGINSAIQFIALLTFLSGLVVAKRMPGQPSHKISF